MSEEISGPQRRNAKAEIFDKHVQETLDEYDAQKLGPAATTHPEPDGPATPRNEPGHESQSAA